MESLNISEARLMKHDHRLVDQIKNNMIADEFFHVVEQRDERMAGFTLNTGYSYHTIPLAADKTLIHTKVRDKFKAEISFI